jgi:hypothetical protein
MRNGMLEPVLTFKGGYNCRHAWLPVDPEWDDELRQKVVDEEPTEIATTLSGGGLITVIAPTGRVERLKSQIPLETKGYLRFHDAESNEAGYVAIHESWHVARLKARAGSNLRQRYDDQLARAMSDAETGDQVQLRSLIGTRADGKSPRGPLVSNSLQAVQNSGLQGVTAHTLGVIDSVHGDGTLPSIPVRARKSSALGEYVHRGDTARHINVMPTAYRELALAHEIGHFIDHKGIGGAGFVSTTSSAQFQEWLDAVDQSRAVKTLRRVQSGDKPRTLPSRPQKWIDYTLQRDELWARSYAQYVAHRSGDPIIRGQISSVRGKYAPLHWTDSDFEPIATAMDKLFEELGWLR